MFRFLIILSLTTASLLSAQVQEAERVIERARENLGLDAKLRSVVTLKIKGRIEPADPKLMPAEVMLVARKPSSQRLEVLIDDILETTLLHGDKGVLIRSSPSDGLSSIRPLSASEFDSIRQSTHHLFCFYEPDLQNFEHVRHLGTTIWREIFCDVLVYNAPIGRKTVRYFSRKDARLVATIREQAGEKIEIVEEGNLTVDGVRFPKTQFYYKDGKLLHRFFVTEVEVNNALEAGVFDIPEKKK